MNDALIRLASRGSPLARYQANYVGRRIIDAGLAAAYEIVVVQTVGDRELQVPISAIARQGVFTSEVEQAVIDGRADVAVHSAKDLPSSHLPDELVLASTPTRADVRDALVGKSLEGLSEGSTIATGSARRRVQLRSLVPHVQFTELRGNIATRLDRVPKDGSAVFALAALERLDLVGHVAEILDIETMLPQVGQGTIALRCRVDDMQCRDVLAGIDNGVVHRALLAERAYLARLGGGCEAPVGAFAQVHETTGAITLEAMLATEDGSEIVRRTREGSDPERLGHELADELASELVGLVTNPDSP